MRLRPTPWQLGVSCCRECASWAREHLEPDAYRAYVRTALEIYCREAERLAISEAEAATREAAK